MKNLYICPKCSAHLRIKDNIVLTVKKGNKKSLVLLSPEVGNYDIFYHHESSEIESGDKVEVFCPVCSANLDAGGKLNNLAHIIMIEDSGEKSDLYFSKVIGEKATYKVSGQKIDRFGDDASNYNYWGYSL
jgi:predicted nucleic-acid-binding Zn-ribbon protein